MEECKHCKLMEECIAINWSNTYQSENFQEPNKIASDTESPSND